jgi:hypothetical protein
MKRTIGILSALALACAVGTTSVRAQEAYIILDDEDTVDTMIEGLTSGDGISSVENDDVWLEDRDAAAALKVTGDAGDSQKFNTNIPNWDFVVTENPAGASEFRYFTFAWRKEGGAGIQLQLHGGGATWGHRYHAGVNEKGWNPSLEVSPDVPAEWEVHTVDLFEDWGEFPLTGIAYSSTSADYGLYDHMAFHKSPEDPFEPLSVDPNSKLPAVWSELKAGK